MSRTCTDRLCARAGDGTCLQKPVMMIMATVRVLEIVVARERLVMNANMIM